MATTDLPGYDLWLERPYQEMCERGDRFVDWCESEGLDPDDPEAGNLYQQWEEGEQEAMYERMAEEAAERKYDDYDERECDGDW